MTDLLLITDVPRLRKIFSKLSDSRDIRLRIANNLEKGAEELTVEKPAIIFVQTHLSGLSAEIILMHLKKQLGRKRSRFVLLATPAQATSETIRLYQGHLDTSLEDDALLNCIKNQITSLLAKPTKKAADDGEGTQTPEPPETVTENVPMLAAPLQELNTPSPSNPAEEPSLVDQGITYAPRQRLSVYSEFNSSFDSAVNDMKPATPLNESEPEQHHDWDKEEIETIELTTKRSKSTMFLLWLAPVLVAVIAVTMIQNKRSPSAPAAEPQKAPAVPVAATKPLSPPSVAVKPPQPENAAATPQQPEKTLPAKPTAEANPALSDKAVISAIAENRGKKGPATAPVESARPTVLPDFIPRYAVDKSFAAANPGWERYKGQVTEFKVFREKGAIKAIQVIDRGGNGVPESFMKAAVRQVSKKPDVAMESTEKKEGYEIQRGETGDNLKVMFYRDDQGGKLRAFVLTWK